MAAVYLLGAAVSATVILLACLAGGYGFLTPLLGGYLGALFVMALLILARLWATRPLEHEADQEKTGLTPDYRPLV